MVAPAEERIAVTGQAAGQVDVDGEGARARRWDVHRMVETTSVAALRAAAT